MPTPAAGLGGGARTRQMFYSSLEYLQLAKGRAGIKPVPTTDYTCLESLVSQEVTS